MSVELAQSLPTTMEAEPHIDALEPTLMDQVLSSRLGKGMTGVLAAATFNAAPALASTSQTETNLQTPSGVTLHVKNAVASAKDVASKKVIFLEDSHIKASSKPKAEQDCHWTKGGFTNSGHDANGRTVYYNDPVRAELCRDEHSPTGWVKVAGGTTGRDCHNAAAEHRVPHMVKNVHVEQLKKLNMKFKLNAVAKAMVAVTCEGSSASAYAKASVNQKFNLKEYLRLKGEGQLHLALKLHDKAVAKAIAKASCADVIQQPPTTTTVVPKDGTQGAGAGTPGETNTGSTVGGTGSGGSPGNETASYPCYDSADTQNGDLNASTEGGIMYTTSADKVDQNQYCIGQAQQPTNP